MKKKVGRKPHGFYEDERAVHEIILLKRRARKGVQDRDGEPMPTPYAVIARELNTENYLTQTGKPWYGRLVCRILERIKKREKPEGEPEKPKRPEKTQLKSTDYLSDEELERFRIACDGQTLVILETLVRTGLRASELCALKVQDLALAKEKRQIDVIDGKGGKDRAVFVGSGVCEILEAHIPPGAKPEDPVFVNEWGRQLTYKNLWDRIKKAKKKSGLEWVTVHKFRHTFSMISYNYKYDLEGLKQQLGHASIRTTSIYAKSASKKRLADMENMDGLFDKKKAK